MQDRQGETTGFETDEATTLFLIMSDVIVMSLRGVLALCLSISTARGVKFQEPNRQLQKNVVVAKDAVECFYMTFYSGSGQGTAP